MNDRSSTLTRGLRLARLLLHILYGLALSALVLPLVAAPERDAIVRRWSRQLLAALDIRLIVHGIPPSATPRGAMLVANHVSWVDIQAIHSVLAVRFVAKHEIRSWPVFGWLAAQARTLFIERTRRHAVGQIADDIAHRLHDGEYVCIFPEGTTTDGSSVEVFKSSLFQAAIAANAPVWPIAIRYPSPGGGINRDMAYCDDLSLWQSVKQVLAQATPAVELHFLPPIMTHGLDRREVALRTRQAIAQALASAY